MGELNYYKYSVIDKANDKKDIYGRGGINHYRQIHTAKMFDDWFDGCKNEYPTSNYIFRGVPEAKYKLYTSAQRLWWQRDFVRGNDDNGADLFKYDKYNDFLQKLLQNARSWNNSLLVNFYNNLGIRLNDFALFSLMQHYGLPSPLLDFTVELKVALYFAFADTRIEPKNDEIDNYLSVYIIDLEANKDFLAVPTEDTLDFKQIYDQRKLYIFSEIKQPGSTVSPVVNHRTNTNFNIINQKGLFIFNFHPWQPIEELEYNFKITHF